MKRKSREAERKAKKKLRIWIWLNIKKSRIPSFFLFFFGYCYSKPGLAQRGLAPLAALSGLFSSTSKKTKNDENDDEGEKTKTRSHRRRHHPRCNPSVATASPSRCSRAPPVRHGRPALPPSPGKPPQERLPEGTTQLAGSPRWEETATLEGEEEEEGGAGE